MLVYSITSRNSFDEIQQFHAQILRVKDKDTFPGAFPVLPSFHSVPSADDSRRGCPNLQSSSLRTSAIWSSSAKSAPMASLSLYLLFPKQLLTLSLHQRSGALQRVVNLLRRWERLASRRRPSSESTSTRPLQSSSATSVGTRTSRHRDLRAGQRTARLPAQEEEGTFLSRRTRTTVDAAGAALSSRRKRDTNAQPRPTFRSRSRKHTLSLDTPPPTPSLPSSHLLSFALSRFLLHLP